ncbi:MAG TPA: chemotaxis protein CheW [Geobacteraceae bacterium]|nr:chemotaxis protein CheW [Geobacteraceae bacterium]
MNSPSQLVVFSLDERYYALDLSAVERTVHMVEVTPLPRAPEIVVGVINVQGRVIPVLNIRKRLSLPERGEALSDQLLIARTERRTMALVVDAVCGVLERSEQEIIEPASVLPGIEYVKGVVKFADGMIFIHNLNDFLSLEEENALYSAIGREESTELQE